MLYFEKTTRDVIITGRRCRQPRWYFFTAVIPPLCVQSRTDDDPLLFGTRNCQNCLTTVLLRLKGRDDGERDFSGSLRTSLFLSAGRRTEE